MSGSPQARGSSQTSWFALGIWFHMIFQGVNEATGENKIQIKAFKGQKDVTFQYTLFWILPDCFDLIQTGKQ